MVKPHGSFNLGTLDELMLVVRRSEGRNEGQEISAMLSMLFYSLKYNS